MQRDCLQALSLAKKAGQVVAGFAKVEAAVQDGQRRGPDQRQRWRADGSRKLRQALRRAGVGRAGN